MCTSIVRFDHLQRGVCIMCLSSSVLAAFLLLGCSRFFRPAGWVYPTSYWLLLLLLCPALQRCQTWCGCFTNVYTCCDVWGFAVCCCARYRTGHNPAGTSSARLACTSPSLLVCAVHGACRLHSITLLGATGQHSDQFVGFLSLLATDNQQPCVRQCLCVLCVYLRLQPCPHAGARTLCLAARFLGLQLWL
jgi:hypothetical protein